MVSLNQIVYRTYAKLNSMIYKSDVPYYHLGTREPNRSPQGRSAHQLLGCRTETKQHATHLTYVVKLRSWPEDSLPVRGYFPSLLSRRVKALPQKAENVGRIMRKTLSDFSHSFALTAYFSRTLPDLGIGGATPDTLPAPSDLVFMAAAPRRGASSSAEIFGYINWRRLWKTLKKEDKTPPKRIRAQGIEETSKVKGIFQGRKNRGDFFSNLTTAQIARRDTSGGAHPDLSSWVARLPTYGASTSLDPEYLTRDRISLGPHFARPRYNLSPRLWLVYGQVKPRSHLVGLVKPSSAAVKARAPTSRPNVSDYSPIIVLLYKKLCSSTSRCVMLRNLLSRSVWDSLSCLEILYRSVRESIIHCLKAHLLLGSAFFAREHVIYSEARLLLERAFFAREHLICFLAREHVLCSGARYLLPSTLFARKHVICSEIYYLDLLEKTSCSGKFITKPSSALAPPRVALLRECISPTSSAHLSPVPH
ncbi:hypothetical protein F511_23471 [Dorcoceras hygrometricum]|uniref:Uncharacterized protein n=1 Tax=Dorcoceras hygrometricum TaxID=472368 RepID=A0A2Z7B7M4_9LAMI|nr:hypothetical protein F511_23471 [Dorcoceras hygrometricum]